MRRYGIYHDWQWEARITSVGQALLHNTKRKFPYRFILINKKDANAFAVPGGFIFVQKGILPYLHNDDEVAALLSHEISHIELDHFAKEYDRANTLNWLGIAALLFTRGQARPWVNAASLSYSMFLEPHWSRVQETQADLHGVSLMVQAGFDPNDMVDFFQELEKSKEYGPLLPWMRSHPSFPDRIAAVKLEIAKYPPVAKKPSSAEDVVFAPTNQTKYVVLQVINYGDVKTTKVEVAGGKDYGFALGDHLILETYAGRQLAGIQIVQLSNELATIIVDQSFGPNFPSKDALENAYAIQQTPNP